MLVLVLLDLHEDLWWQTLWSMEFQWLPNDAELPIQLVLSDRPCHSFLLLLPSRVCGFANRWWHRYGLQSCQLWNVCTEIARDREWRGHKSALVLCLYHAIENCDDTPLLDHIRCSWQYNRSACSSYIDSSNMDLHIHFPGKNGGHKLHSKVNTLRLRVSNIMNVWWQNKILSNL